MKTFLRLQVEHQWGVLQPDRVAADGVVERVAGGEGRSAPVQEHGGRAVSLGVHIVWRRWRGHEAISDSWEIH